MKQNLSEGSLGDEDDAWTLNTRTAQRKCMIANSTMKNNRNIIECCNNTHQGHHVPANKRVLALWTLVTLLVWLVYSGGQFGFLQPTSSYISWGWCSTVRSCSPQGQLHSIRQ